jgi:hypothetical protein
MLPIMGGRGGSREPYAVRVAHPPVIDPKRKMVKGPYYYKAFWSTVALLL